MTTLNIMHYTLAASSNKVPRVPQQTNILRGGNAKTAFYFFAVTYSTVRLVSQQWGANVRHSAMPPSLDNNKEHTLQY